MYRVYPVDRNGAGSFVNADTVSATVTATLPPAIPTGITVNPIDNDSITVSWNASARASTYNIQYRVAGTSSWTAGPTGVTITSATVNGHNPNTIYNFQVRAVNTGGSSAWSSTVSGTTPNIPVPLTPPTPTGVTATPIDHERITVRWNASARATSYLVQRRVSGPSQWFVSGSGVTDTFHTATGLTEETTYEFRVSATNSGGTSSFSLVVRATTPGEVFIPTTPTGLSSSPVSRDRVALSWNAVSAATTYELQHRRSGTSGWSTGNIITGITTTSYTITTLEAATDWDFRIRARNVAGASAWSDFITDAREEPAPSIPTGLTFVSATTTTITVSWNTVIGSQTYEVRRSVAETNVWRSNANITATSYTIIGLISGSAYNCLLYTSPSPRDS